MTENINKKLLNEIRRTGFPSELWTLAVLRAAGWLTTGNSYYLDEDEQKGREIDIEAQRNIFDKDGEPSVCVWSILAIEVKKSDKPWVIFTSPRQRFEGEGYGILNHVHNVSSETLPYEAIMKKHPSRKMSRIGRSSYIAFSDNETNPRIYGALVSASKAAYALHKGYADHKKAYDDIPFESPFEVAFYTPVVVLDGRLFECYLDNTGELTIEEVSSISYSLHYLSTRYESRRYLIDIVTAKALEAYAESHTVWLTDMYTHIVSKT